MITVLPPTIEEILLWCGRGVVVTLPGCPFDMPMRVAEGTKIGLVAHKRGYADVMFHGLASADNTPVSLELFPSDAWWKHIDKSDFRMVDDHDGTYLPDADAVITDGKWVRSEHDLNGVEVRVRANGYEPFCRRCDLTLAPPYVIKLSRHQETVNLPVLLDNGRVGQMTLRGVDVSPSDLHLAGYTLSEGRLVFSEREPEPPAADRSDTAPAPQRRLSFLTGFLSGLVVSMALMICYMIFFL